MLLPIEGESAEGMWENDSQQTIWPNDFWPNDKAGNT